jgi:hypothetical protein
MIDFQWWRCRDGYRLEIKQSREYLVSASDRFDYYRPLDIGSLFAIFADAGPTAEGMQSFCNRFGLLGGERADLAPLGKPTSESASVDDFLKQHRAMRRALDLIESGDVPELVRLWNSSDGFPLIRTKLRISGNGAVEMVFAPHALAQAMWLQFAEVASSRSQLRRCERCSTPFVVGSTTGRRRSSKWCSNACKSRHTRRERRKTRLRINLFFRLQPEIRFVDLPTRRCDRRFLLHQMCPLPS